jgi:hypothetical protein
MRSTPSVALPCLLTIMLLAGLPVAAAPSDQSATAARALVQSLQEAKLEAIAAPDPTEPGAFVAALHIPGGQLLVVRARHPSTAALAARLTAGQFRDMYMDLQATPTADGKLFVMDAGADGIADAGDDGNVDVVYENGALQAMFNGAKAQRLSGKAYDEKLQQADAKYARLLQVLTSAAEQTQQR